jgi:hypothetical protein
VRESDLRVLFKRQAAIELPPAPISIPAARRIGRARLLRRRAVAFGSPVLAAAAVVAVVLAGLFAAGPRQPATTLGSPAAPKLFNPLVPYASVTWYPYRPGLVGSLGWHTGLLLNAFSRSPAKSTNVVLYAAGWCTLKSASLSCGSTPAGTRVEATVSGQAPDVQGQAAYWARYAGGDLAPFRPPSGITQMLAFQYARGGWAVVESTGTPADVLRVAASLRSGQTSPLRFPFRLTGLPWAWSRVLSARFTQPGPGARAPTENVLLLGSPATRLGTLPRDTLTVLTGTQTIQGPRCRIKTAPVGQPSPASQASQPSQPSRPVACPSKVINGYLVFLNTPPEPGKQTLFSPDADGLYLYEQTTGPGAPLSPASVLAGHLQLLGPDPANWTTAPVSP